MVCFPSFLDRYIVLAIIWNKPPNPPNHLFHRQNITKGDKTTTTNTNADRGARLRYGSACVRSGFSSTLRAVPLGTNSQQQHERRMRRNCLVFRINETRSRDDVAHL